LKPDSKDTITLPIAFLIAPGMSSKTIIGNDFLEHQEAILNLDVSALVLRASPMKSFCVPEWIPHALSSSIQRRIILPGCQMTIQLETTMKPQNKDSNQYYIESLRCQDTLLIAYSIGDLSNNIKPTEGLNVEQHSLTIS
jgi:hypothetical protein